MLFVFIYYTNEQGNIRNYYVYLQRTRERTICIQRAVLYKRKVIAKSNKSFDYICMKQKVDGCPRDDWKKVSSRFVRS